MRQRQDEEKGGLKEGDLAVPRLGVGAAIPPTSHTPLIVCVSHHVVKKKASTRRVILQVIKY